MLRARFEIRAIVLAGVLAASCCVGGARAEDAGPRAPEASEYALLNRLFESENLLLGEHESFIEELMQAAEAAPGSPVAELALTWLSTPIAEVPPTATLVENLRTRLSAIRSAAGRNGFVAELARELESGLAMRAGDDARARELTAEFGAVRDWAVIYPFGQVSLGDFGRVFAPQLDDDPGLKVTSKGKQRSWRPVTGNDPRRVEVWLPADGGTGFAFARAVVSTEKELDAFIHLRADSSARLWIDGELALEIDGFRDRVPDEVFVPITLAAGVHVLRLQAPAGQSFNLRFVDGDGHPLAVASGDPLEAVAETAGWQPRPAKLHERALEFWQAASAAPASDADAIRESGLAHLATGLLADRHDDQDLALVATEAGVAAAGNLPSALIEYGRMLLETEYRPPAIAENQARSNFESAGELSPRAVMASLALAEIELERDRHKEAIDLVEAALLRVPENRAATLKLVDIYMSEGWNEEARNILQAMAIADPESIVIKGRLGRVEQARGNFREADRLWTELRAKLGRGDAVTRRNADDLEVRGDRAGAQAILEQLLARNPEDASAIESLIEFHERGDDFASALALVEDLIAKHPERADLIVKRADLLMLLDRRDDALSAYTEFLAREPGVHEVREYIAYLSGDETKITSEFIKTLEQLEAIPTAADYPEAASLLMLDEAVCIIYPGGASFTDTYSCRKALTAEGVEAVAGASFRGELVLARTHKADGTVLEPIKVSSGGFEMPGVEVGAIVELRYLSHAPGEDGRFPAYGWFFQDTGFAEPFHHSRLVLIEMPGAPHVEIETRNFTGTHRVEERDGMKVQIWEVERSPRLVREFQMPAADEIVPSIHIESPAEWNDVLAAGRRMEEQARTSIAVDLKAEELASGLQDPEAIARVLYDFVNAHVKQESFANPTITLAAGQGSRPLLFLAMARSLGLDVRTVEIGPNPAIEATGDLDFPSSIFRSSNIIAVHDQDRRTFIDLSSRFLPYGKLAPGIGGSIALIHGPDAVEITSLPGAEIDRVLGVHIATVAIESQDLAKIDGTLTWDGMRGAFIKQSFESLESAVRRQTVASVLGQFYPGFSLVSYDLPGLEIPGEPMVIEFHGTSKQILSGSGKVRELPTGFAQLGLQRGLIRESERKFDYVSSNLAAGLSRVQITLPEGASFESLPDAVTLFSPLGTYRLDVRPDGANAIAIERQVQLIPGRLRPAQYSDFVKYCQRADRSDQSRIKIRF